jgi:hypothetical protein
MSLLLHDTSLTRSQPEGLSQTGLLPAITGWLGSVSNPSCIGSSWKDTGPLMRALFAHRDAEHVTREALGAYRKLLSAFCGVLSYLSPFWSALLEAALEGTS